MSLLPPQSGGRPPPCGLLVAPEGRRGRPPLGVLVVAQEGARVTRVAQRRPQPLVLRYGPPKVAGRDDLDLNRQHIRVLVGRGPAHAALTGIAQVAMRRGGGC